ncbi:hypothetical protein JCM1840_002842 [Sporobolomyces johnsonii]
MALQPPTKLTSASKLSAWVTIDDVPVPVYQVEEMDNKVTCFIGAVEGKEFKVGFENVGFSGSELDAHLLLDGAKVNGGTTRSRFKPGMLNGLRESPTTIRPYAFAKLAVTDDPNLASNDENFIKNVGTIQVHVYRVNFLGEKPFAKRPLEGVKNQVIDERSKKATLSHQANLGQPKLTPDRHSFSTTFEYVDKRSQPSQIFEFKYRSRALLELQGLVEPAPTPPQAVAGPSTSNGNKRKASTPLQVDHDGAIVLSSDDDDSDQKDVRGALAEIAHHEAEIERIKKSMKQHGSKKVKEEPGSKEVKEEPGSREVKKDERLVIDLLGEGPSEE